jgi:hypothetical protein
MRYTFRHMNDYKTIDEFKECAGYDINGQWYPRVTKIVEIKAKPALYRYYGELSSFDEGERIKEISANEGTMIHEAAEAVLTGQTPLVDPSIAAPIAALRKFLEGKNIQIDAEFVEKRIAHHGERYAGTIDAMALIDGKFGVLDIKTSQSIYRDYNLQTSAYMAALEPDYPTLQSRWILRIDQKRSCIRCGATMRSKGGRDKIKLPWQFRMRRIAESCPHEWSDLQGEVELQEFPYWRNDYQAFLGAKKLWEWENEEILKKVGYLR